MSLDSKLPPDSEDCFCYKLPVENKAAVGPQKIGSVLSKAVCGGTFVCGGIVGTSLGLYLSRLSREEPIYFLDYVRSSALGAAVGLGLAAGLLSMGVLRKGKGYIDHD